MRFPMTLGGITKVMTIGSLLILFVMLPFQYFVVLTNVPVPELKFAVLGTLALVGGVLLVTVALAPRAVRVDSRRLVVERLFWPDFEVPLRQVTAVQPGPELTMMRGQVRRVAGNGGLMGFTGLYHVSEVGLVRCWATRLGLATVLVRRGDERPLLLGVDDPAGLLQALHRATHL
jgi:hypothetical protein